MRRPSASARRARPAPPCRSPTGRAPARRTSTRTGKNLRPPSGCPCRLTSPTDYANNSWTRHDKRCGRQLPTANSCFSAGPGRADRHWNTARLRANGRPAMSHLINRQARHKNRQAPAGRCCESTATRGQAPRFVALAERQTEKRLAGAPARAPAITPPSRGARGARAGLQGVEEVHEVGLLLVGQADGEALVVEVDHVQQRFGRAVVEERRARRQPAQDRPLELADVLALAGDLRAAGIGGAEGLAGERARVALQGEY